MKTIIPILVVAACLLAGCAVFPHRTLWHEPFYEDVTLSLKHPSPVGAGGATLISMKSPNAVRIKFFTSIYQASVGEEFKLVKGHGTEFPPYTLKSVDMQNKSVVVTVESQRYY